MSRLSSICLERSNQLGICSPLSFHSAKARAKTSGAVKSQRSLARPCELYDAVSRVHPTVLSYSSAPLEQFREHETTQSSDLPFSLLPFADSHLFAPPTWKTSIQLLYCTALPHYALPVARRPLWKVIQRDNN